MTPWIIALGIIVVGVVGIVACLMLADLASNTGKHDDFHDEGEP